MLQDTAIKSAREPRNSGRFTGRAAWKATGAIRNRIAHIIER